MSFIGITGEVPVVVCAPRGHHVLVSYLNLRSCFEVVNLVSVSRSSQGSRTGTMGGNGLGLERGFVPLWWLGHWFIFSV